MNFFIDRPIFATAVAFLMVIAGVTADSVTQSLPSSMA